MRDGQERLVDAPMWDLPVRLFHWAFAACFAISWVSGQAEERDLHYASGMVLFGLVIFRLLWGLVGSPTARFSHFLRWPRAAFSYLRQALAHRAPSYSFGHNAAGGLMVAALVLLIGVQAVSGMASTDDIIFEGPLYGRLPEWLAGPLERIHEPLANILLALAAQPPDHNSPRLQTAPVEPLGRAPRGVGVEERCRENRGYVGARETE